MYFNLNEFVKALNYDSIGLLSVENLQTLSKNPVKKKILPSNK